MSHIISMDGTHINYEQTGTGPAVILVDAALSDLKTTVKLASHLSEHFTVINYDRRGRGKSTDTLPYTIQREIEDIEALIDAAGGTASLFGSSSGAVLALDAASHLGPRVKRLFMYEPPFIVDSSWLPMSDYFIDEIRDLLSQGQRNEAVKRFFHKGMGIPGFAVTLMRWLMPGWSRMRSMAHTLPYDLTVMAGLQAGKPLPVQRWASLTVPTRVMVGSKSEAFFHNGAKALADLLPHVQYCPLEGRDHSAVHMAPQAIAAEMIAFFKA